MIRYSTIILTLLFLPSLTGAQNPTIDSLWDAVKDAESLPRKVDEFNRVAQEYKLIDPKETIDISRRALSLAIRIKYDEGIFYAYNNLGSAFNGIGQSDSALYYFTRAYKMAIAFEDEYALSVIKNNFGLYYLFRGNYPLAMQFFQESLISIDEPGNYLDPVTIYNNIGVIHQEQGNPEKAIEYYQKAGDASIAAGNRSFANLCYGNIHLVEGNFAEAVGYYEEALSKYREDHDELNIGKSLLYLGECYLGIGDYQQARDYLNESLAIYDRLGMVPDAVEIYRKIATAYEAVGRHETALEFYHRAADLGGASELNTILVPVYEALARQYANKEDYKTAYEYQLRYQELYDTIYNNETKDRIDQLEMSHELAFNKAERDRLRAEREKREAVVKQRTVLAVSSALFMVLFAVLLVVYYRANQQKRAINKVLGTKVKQRTAELELVNNKLLESNAELERVNDRLLESNEELERFTYIASHDLKEPLRNITSFINLIERKLERNADADLQEYMNYVTRNARQMYNLIEDVLNFSRIAALEVKGTKCIELNALMIDIEAALTRLFHEKQAEIKIPEPLPSVRAHRTHVFMLIKNLIENGLKYNESEQPQISITYREEEAFYRFFVRDNGIGIAPKYHEQIFEMFKRMSTREKYEGTGIGLATCKKIVSKYGGKIGLESEVGKGTIFFFTWPKVREEG